MSLSIVEGICYEVSLQHDRSRPSSRNAFAVESAMHLNQSAAERAQNGRGDAVAAMAIDSEIWA